MPAPGAKEGIILVADDNEAHRDRLVGPVGGQGYHGITPWNVTIQRFAEGHKARP